MRRSSPPRTRLVGVALLVTLLAGCGKSLPRPEDLPGDDLTKQAKGRRILERALTAHGGEEAWAEARVMRYHLRDTWEPRAAWMCPYPLDDPVIGLTFDYRTNGGRMEFPEAPGAIWGTQGVLGWGVRDGERVEGAAAAAATVILGMARLLGMPFVLGDPHERVYYAGKRDLAGVAHESLLVLFPEAGGGGETRYLAYFDPKAGTLKRIEYTLPGRAGLLEGYADYVSWLSAEDLLVAKRVEIGIRRPFTAAVDTLEVETVDVGVSVDPAQFAPPDLPVSGK
ncbi:MAG: hypothetical protein KC466_03930 [Myxococcales bacterium]|nr:hypothetical protein [Myxococcales bacterium]